MKGRVLHAVAVDLADVEVGLHGCDVGGGDPVCGAPDAVRGCFVLEWDWVRLGFIYGEGGCLTDVVG